MNVTDFTGILYYSEKGSNPDYEYWRWNGPQALQTPVVVTYAFLEDSDLQSVTETYYRVNGVQTFNNQHRQQFRAAAEVFEQTAGIIFVEVDSSTPAMVNIQGVIGSGLGGWANVARATDAATASGYYVIDVGAGGDLGEPQWFETLLHELGHAVGLEHSFEGGIRIDPSIDNTNTTVMSYTDSPGSLTTLTTLDAQALRYLYGDPVDTSDWTFRSTPEKLWIKGGTGADTIYGALGKNVLQGLGGNDTIYGRESADYIHGRSGADSLYGSYGNDQLRGGGGGDTLYGGSGNDLMLGGSGNDTLIGELGNDRLIGKKGADILRGGAGSDSLFGSTGNDTLSGGAGNDKLYGGAGDDRLTGDSGADTFVFRAFDAGGNDTIADYERGVDTISLEVAAWTFQSATLSASSGGVEFVFAGGGSNGFVLDILGLSVAEAQNEWNLI